MLCDYSSEQASSTYMTENAERGHTELARS